jgi:hypothetical protein
MAKPVWAAKQWFEVWCEGASDHSTQGHRIDARRRSRKTAERIAEELRATRSYVKVWLVEVNRLGGKR